MLKKNVFKIAAAFIMAVSLASCSKSEKSYPNDVFNEKLGTPGYAVEILGVNSNMPLPDTSLISAGRNNPYTYICKHGGAAQSIVVDVDPRDNIGDLKSVEPVDRADYTAANYNKLINNGTVYLETFLTEDKTPKCSETSPIDAIIAASEIIRPMNGQKYIAIFHSGIITKGYGSMTSLDFDVDTAIDALAQSDAIPDLTGVKVEWYGMNNVCGSQETPNEKNKNTLRKFWEAYFAKAGAEYQNMSEIYSVVNEPDSSFPNVRSVSVGEIVSIEELSCDTPADDFKGIEFPSDGSFAFKPDTAEFVDIAAAKNDIRPFAEYLRSPNAMENVVLVGTTATVGDAESSVVLSKERAEAIKALIVEEGIDAGRIQAFGGGYTDTDFVVNDLDNNNKLIEASAKLNRAVHAVSSTDTRVQKYLN